MSDAEARRIENGLREHLDPSVAKRFPRWSILDRTDSTNGHLRRLADAGAPDGSLVIADQQTAGRGSRGRSWHSAPGLGLYVSVLIRVDAGEDPALLPRWTLLASLAACEACRTVTGCEVILKWPNDVLFGARKLGGVLAEARSSPGGGGDLVVGVGINVGHAEADFPKELRGTAISLRAVAGGAIICRERLAARMLERFAEWSDRLRAGDWDAVARRWLECAPGARGRPVWVARGDDERYRGRTAGIDRTGALRVEGPNGTLVVVHSGESVIEEA